MDWPGGRDGRRSSSGGEPSFYWSSRRLLTGRHDNRLTQHLTSGDRRDAVISIYSIITNGIDGAVMLITRLFTCDSDTPALLSYSALTSLHLVCLTQFTLWLGHYANECRRSMTKQSTATSFVYVFNQQFSPFPT